MPVIPFHDETPTGRAPAVTVAIIVINVASLIFTSTMNLHDRREFQARYGFVPARLLHIRDGHPVKVPLYSHQEWAELRPPLGEESVELPSDPRQIFLTMGTSLFLHAGWLHLLGNMWFFWIFGRNVEDRLGHVPFLIFYLSGGLIASGCHFLMTEGGGGSTMPVIGASGAVAATLGAYAVTYPFSRIRTVIFVVFFFTVVELPALIVLGFWFLMQMVNAAQVVNINIGGGVAWWAHIGGFLAGAAIMPLLTAVVAKRDAPRENEIPGTGQRDVDGSIESDLTNE